MYVFMCVCVYYSHCFEDNDVCIVCAHDVLIDYVMARDALIT